MVFASSKLMRVIPVDENNLWKVIVERIEAGEYVFFDMVLRSRWDYSGKIMILAASKIKFIDIRYKVF